MSDLAARVRALCDEPFDRLEVEYIEGEVTIVPVVRVLDLRDALSEPASSDDTEPEADSDCHDCGGGGVLYEAHDGGQHPIHCSCTAAQPAAEPGDVDALARWERDRGHRREGGRAVSRVLPGMAFLACILAANHVTTEYGMVPVGFGLTATAGTYLAGAMFVLRDNVQDIYGKGWALALIVAGALLSYLVADPFIALASGVAFLVSETVDLAVYTPLRRRGYVRAAIASNIVGAFVDTVLFLWIAGFPIVDAVAGQMAGKVTITAVVAALVVVVRARRAVAA